MRLLLIRHGESMHSLRGMIAGPASCPGLTERGFQQAQMLVDRFCATGEVSGWGICQISPGINLIGLSILIGWRVAGWLGLALALAGLLLPSAAITIALTAGYARVENVPMVRAALRGMAPATVGLGLLLAYTMARPLLAAGRREGHASLALAWALLIGSALATAFIPIPVLVVLWGAGALAALGQWRLTARHGRAR